MTEYYNHQNIINDIISFRNNIIQNTVKCHSQYLPINYNQVLKLKYRKLPENITQYYTKLVLFENNIIRDHCKKYDKYVKNLGYFLHCIIYNLARYNFNKNKSIYKFNHWENKESLPEMFRQSDEKTSWYSDFNAGQLIMQKDIFGSPFNVKDSLVKVVWKFSNENRIIAGYNCRKATGIIMDSVYVFAFYTDEITIPGGPCSVNGLPGMILGLTIPRLFSSWMATKITIASNPPLITEPAALKNTFNMKSVYTTIIEKTKGWMGNEDDPESRKWLDQLIWNLML
jgi:GLPGLI family protein